LNSSQLRNDYGSIQQFIGLVQEKKTNIFGNNRNQRKIKIGRVSLASGQASKTGYSYIVRSYLPEDNPTKNPFEYQQETLEKTTDRAARAVDPLKIVKIKSRSSIRLAWLKPTRVEKTIKKKTFKDGKIYVGEVDAEGSADGQGCIFYPVGDHSTRFPQGALYCGHFHDGAPEGKGSVSSTEGLLMDAEFQQGKSNGFGFFSSDDGFVVVGNCKDDIFLGPSLWIGEVEFASGNFNKYGLHGQGQLMDKSQRIRIPILDFDDLSDTRPPQSSEPSNLHLTEHECCTPMTWSRNPSNQMATADFLSKLFVSEHL